MDTLSYVLSGVGLALLLGMAYLYHAYTVVKRDLVAALEKLQWQGSEIASLSASLEAKARIITDMQAAAVREYQNSSKKVEERVANSSGSGIMTEIKSMFDDVD